MSLQFSDEDVQTPKAAMPETVCHILHLEVRAHRACNKHARGDGVAALNQPPVQKVDRRWIRRVGRWRLKINLDSQ